MKTFELTFDEYQMIRALIKTQRFNKNPVISDLRKKFSVEEVVPVRVVKGEKG